MSHSEEGCHDDRHIGQAVKLGLAFGQVEKQSLSTLSAAAIRQVAKQRLNKLQELGGLTQAEADALRTRVDTPGSDVAVPSILGPDGQLTLAGVLAKQLPDSALEDVDDVTAAEVYVAATAGLGAGIIGFVVCGTPCAVIAAWDAGGIVASL
jgi:hypothetical protein